MYSEINNDVNHTLFLHYDITLVAKDTFVLKCLYETLRQNSILELCYTSFFGICKPHKWNYILIVIKFYYYLNSYYA